MYIVVSIKVNEKTFVAVKLGDLIEGLYILEVETSSGIERIKIIKE